jgi:6-phosphogluconate dehydrogenase
MQLIGEVYDIMKHVLKMSNDEMAAVFTEWNTTELESYLIEITGTILAKKDDLTDSGHVVDYVLDKTGMKGTGRWTIQEAAERSVAAPTMAASLDARYISARKDERVKASTILKGPDMTAAEIPVHKAQLLEDLKGALYCAKVCSYAQGLGIIKGCSDDYNWNVNLSECARLWKGGCIIRAALLQKIQDALARDKMLPNLIQDPVIAGELNERTAGWRRAVVVAIGYGISTPALTGSLNYFDSYRRANLPANLTQAQRDFFGGHTYERTDREGVFHTTWTDAHKSIGDISERMAGEV